MSRTKYARQYSNLADYIKDTDPDLAELIDDLGIHRLFIPRRNTSGITFLHPNKESTKELYKLVDSNPNSATDYIKSLLIVDYVKGLKDFSKQLTTLAEKKLPVREVSLDKVYLTNNSVISKTNANINFTGDNIMVFDISGLVPIDGEKSMIETNGKRRTKPKSADDPDRALFFESILEQHFAEMIRKPKRNPALEVILSIIRYLEMNETDKSLILTIKSFLLPDALTSLALILQPYYTGSDKYITDYIFIDFATEYTNNYASYTLISNPFELYAKYVMECTTQFAGLLEWIETERTYIRENCTKKNINTLLISFYDKIAKHKELPTRRKNPSLALCEAEMIVMSALMWEQDTNLADLRSFYRTKCNLNYVYLISVDNIKNSGLAFYYSTVWLVVRSCALFHIANNVKRELVALSSDGIADDRYCVSLYNNIDTPAGDPVYYSSMYNKVKKQLADAPSMSMPYTISPKQLSKTQIAERNKTIEDEKFTIKKKLDNDNSF